jgi:cellulose synthase operon protein C
LGDLRAGPAAPALARLALEPGSSLRAMAIGAVARIGDERASQILIGALDADEPELRDLATWALGFTGGDDATAALIDLLKDGESWSQQALAAVGLGRIGGERAEAALDAVIEEHAASGSSSVDLEAVVWALGRLESERSVDELATVLRRAPPELRGMAAWSLSRVGSEEAVEALVDAYWSEDTSLRQVAARGLVQLAAGPDGELNTAREVAHDLQFVDEHRHDMRVSALISSLREEALALEVGMEAGFISNHRDVLARAGAEKLDSGSARERRIVLRDLADMATGSGFGVLSPTGERDHEAVSRVVKALVEELRELAGSEDRRLLRPAATLLGVLGDAKDYDRLRELVEHDDPGVREAATSALGHMTASADVVQTVQGRLADSSFGVRAAAASSLGELLGADDPGAERATELLVEALDDDYRAVREAAARGLVALGGEAAITGLGRRLPDLPTSVQLVALRALADSDSAAAEEALAPFLEHADTRLRRAAAGR